MSSGSVRLTKCRGALRKTLIEDGRTTGRLAGRELEKGPGQCRQRAGRGG